MRRLADNVRGLLPYLRGIEFLIGDQFVIEIGCGTRLADNPLALPVQAGEVIFDPLEN